ncbi:MAG: adenosylcobinamide-GDP ribazoletransferase [Pseudomonadota bacterium]
MNSFFIALSLMTRLPMAQRVSTSASKDEQQRSMYYYPLVGAVLAALLIIVACATSFIVDPLLSACVLLLFWIGLTGALHLDGLADSWDAYFAHHGDSESTRRVLKDPANGTMAVVSVVMIIVLKLAALNYLFGSADEFAPALFATLMLPRTAVLLLMLTTSYANDGGLATTLSDAQSPRITYSIVAITIVFLALLIGPGPVCIALLLIGFLLVWWRHRWLAMIGGYTGDVLGAYIEMSECLVLLVLVVSLVN